MSDRLKTIVERMDIRSDDKVLEIGCGHGVAATFICEKLDTGHLTAIDRSKKMIDAASRRNAEYIRSGKAEFLVGNLEDVNFDSRRFDKILAVRVRLFYSEPERANAIVRKWLAPNGKIFAVYDEP